MSKISLQNLMLEIAPWLSKPLEVGDNKIKFLPENYQQYMTHEISNILKI